jgi:hypothetical protein
VRAASGEFDEGHSFSANIADESFEQRFLALWLSSGPADSLLKSASYLLPTLARRKRGSNSRVVFSKWPGTARTKAVQKLTKSNRGT